MNTIIKEEKNVAPIRQEIVDSILTTSSFSGIGNLKRTRNRLNKGLINSLRHQISNIEEESKVKTI